MSDERRNRLILSPLPEYEPEVGLLLAMLEETRGRTTSWLVGVTDGELAWTPSPGGNSIGTILYHLALIEADWLYAEVLEQPEYAADASAHFPHAVRDEDDRLTHVAGESLADALARLDAIRGLLLDAFRGMSAAEFRRVRSLPEYDVTPEYVLHHLMQHEAEHRGEIGMLRILAALRPSANSG